MRRILNNLIYCFIFTWKLCNAVEHCASDSNRCFAFVSDQSLEWFSAQEFCETRFYGGFLASIRNAFENRLIQDFLRGSPASSDLWIGGFRLGDSGYLWSDGAAFFYNQFAPGQPASDGSCIQMCRNDENGCRAGQWKATPCIGQGFPFLCEYQGGPNITSSISPSSATTTNSACPPQTTVRPAIPCPVNIIFLIDGSNGVTADQFTKQITFISTIFSNTWTYDEIGIAIGLYDDTTPTNFNVIAPFGAISDADIAQSLVQGAFQEGDTASITTALKVTLTHFPGGLPCVPQRTFLFASTSVDADIASAVPYANQLKAMGSLVIIAMGPNANAFKLQTLGTHVFSWNNFDNMPPDLASSIVSAMCSA